MVIQARAPAARKGVVSQGAAGRVAPERLGKAQAAAGRAPARVAIHVPAQGERESEALGRGPAQEAQGPAIRARGVAGSLRPGKR